MTSPQNPSWSSVLKFCAPQLNQPRATVQRYVAILLLGWGAIAAAPSALAQGSLTNGFTHQATLAPVGAMHVWTFSAAAGDRIVIRAGEITQTNTLNVRLTLLNPDGVQVALDSDALSAEIAITATNTGESRNLYPCKRIA